MPVHASGPRNAKLAGIGMAPAREEMITGVPFVGPSGRILNDALRTAGISRDDIFMTNLLDEPIPPTTNSIYLMPSETVNRGLARVKAELEEVKPNVVLLLGSDPLRALCSLSGITKYRGSILTSTMVPRLKCVPAMHPANFIRGQWKWLPVFKYIDVPRFVAEAQSSSLDLPERRAITGPSFKMVLDYIRWLHTQEIIGVDIEGYGEISCVGVGASASEAMCVPFARPGQGHYWTLPEEATIWKALAGLLQAKPLVAQNASFDFMYFWLHGVYPSTLWMDTMTAHHCLYPDFGGAADEWNKRPRDIDNPGHGLAFINSQYTRTPYYKDDGRHWRPELGEHAFWRYNCMDVMVTLDAAFQMKAELDKKNLWPFYQEYYIRPFWHAMRMEWEGIKIDTELREKAKAEYETRARELGQLINKTLGYQLNVNSPKQMKKLLYEEKGYQLKTNPKTGKATADKGALAYFAARKGDQVLQWILELRKITDLIGDVLSQKLDADDRIHTHYKIGGTNGARWSSTKSILGSGTNLQNVPRDGIARRLFLAS